VPVAAAGLADLLVGDAREAVPQRVLEDLLAQPAHLLLLASEHVEAAALVGCRGGERVARALELGERYQARAASAARDRAVRASEVSKLTVEPGDLVAERAACRGLLNFGIPGFSSHIDGDPGMLLDWRHLSRLSVRSG
jgi:hypothetical protein